MFNLPDCDFHCKSSIYYKPATRLTSNYRVQPARSPITIMRPCTHNVPTNNHRTMHHRTDPTFSNFSHNLPTKSAVLTLYTTFRNQPPARRPVALSQFNRNTVSSTCYRSTHSSSSLVHVAASVADLSTRQNVVNTSVCECIAYAHVTHSMSNWREILSIQSTSAALSQAVSFTKTHFLLATIPSPHYPFS